MADPFGYLTLAAGVVGTFTVQAEADKEFAGRTADYRVVSLRVACLEGSLPVYVRCDGVDPVIATYPSEWLLPGGELEITAPGQTDTAELRAISGATALLAVHSIRARR